MFFYLILLFTIVPIFELYLLVRVAQYLGAFNAVMIVIFTGIFGAYLARLEGLRVLFSVQRDLQEGKMPTEGLLDGVLILVGAVLLITPGILTDVVGFILVIPSTRIIIKFWLTRQIKKTIDKKQGVIVTDGYSEDEN